MELPPHLQAMLIVDATLVGVPNPWQILCAVVIVCSLAICICTHLCVRFILLPLLHALKLLDNSSQFMIYDLDACT